MVASSGSERCLCLLQPLEPLSSVSSLEVHFDLLDLTELTDMSDQELAEVFADSDDENLATESPAGEAACWLKGCSGGGPGAPGPSGPYLERHPFYPTVYSTCSC